MDIRRKQIAEIVREIARDGREFREPYWSKRILALLTHRTEAEAARYRDALEEIIKLYGADCPKDFAKIARRALEECEDWDKCPTFYDGCNCVRPTESEAVEKIVDAIIEGRCIRQHAIEDLSALTARYRKALEDVLVNLEGIGSLACNCGWTADECERIARRSLQTDTEQ